MTTATTAPTNRLTPGPRALAGGGLNSVRRNPLLVVLASWCWSSS
ncbi:hypothetical protein ACFSUJ_34585 [Streptomyces lusitanus]